MDNKNDNRINLSYVSLGVLVLVTFFTALYMKGLNSGIPLYYDSIGYSATVGGTFVAVFTIASTAMRLIGGQITDSFSHYKVLLASLAGLFVGVALPAVTDAFAVVMVSRVIQGASFALATNVMTVAVMSSADKKHIGKRVGIKGAGTSLGTMLGALLSTLLLDKAGYEAFYLFYAAIMLVSVVVIVVWHKIQKKYTDTTTEKNAQNETSSSKNNSTHSQQIKEKRTFKEIISAYFIPSVAPYLAMSFARRLPKGLCISFILVFARHVGIEMGAAFFVVAGATTLTCRLCGGKLFDSDKTWLLLPLISVQIIGFAVLCLFPSFPALIVAAVGYGISVGTTSPFIKTLTAKAVPQEHWGVANGEIYFFGDMGKALGAFCGGLLIDATSKSFVPKIALCFAIVTALFTALALLMQHRAKKHNNL